MKLFLTTQGIYLLNNSKSYLLANTDFDSLLNREDLMAYLLEYCSKNSEAEIEEEDLCKIALAPLQSQEVWAAGVTYYRSKKARMEESKESGGSTFYDKIYDAARPELFFKSAASRVRGTKQSVRIRKDSTWSVPEPELTLLISSSKKIIGYTIGNDMSARDIEGENPLYLPQAKSYTGSAALGPCVLILDHPINPQNKIEIQVHRNNQIVFEGQTLISEIKRSFDELVNYLFLEMDFPQGCYLMTGTGIVPEDSFSIQKQDAIRITIEGIGTLENWVE